MKYLFSQLIALYFVCEPVVRALCCDLKVGG